MAENRESTILEVQLDAGKVASELTELSRKIALLKNEQKQLDAEYKSGQISLTEYTKSMAAVKDELTWTQKQQKGLIATQKLLTAETNTYSDSLNGERQKLADMQKAYDQLDKSMRESDGGKAFLAAIKAQSDAVKNLEEETGRFQRNVGNYPQAIKGIIPYFDKFEGALGKVGVSLSDLGSDAKSALSSIGGGMKNLGKQAMSALANPIMAAIAAVLVTLKMLYDAFQRSEAAQLHWQKMTAPFVSLWQNLQRVFDDVVKTVLQVTSVFDKNGKTLEVITRLYLLPFNEILTVIRLALLNLNKTFEIWTKTAKLAFDGIKTAIENSPLAPFFERVRNNIETVKKTLSEFGSQVRDTMSQLAQSDVAKFLGLDTYVQDVKGVVGANQELIDSNNKIAESEAAVRKQRAENLMADADAENRVAELRAKVAEKDKYTAKERLQMLDEADAKEQEIAQRAYELAKQEYEAEVLRNSLTQSNAEDKEREAQAYAAMVSAETHYNNQIRRLKEQTVTARKEITAEQSKAAEEARRRAAEEAKRLEEQAKALQALEDTMRRRRQTDLENTIEDLQSAMQRELEVVGLTEQQKQEIREYYATEEKRIKDEAAAAEKAKADADAEAEAERERKRLEAIQAARLEFGIEEGKTQEEQELERLEAAREQELLNDEEYQQAKSAIQQKYADERSKKEQEELNRAKEAMQERTKALASSLGQLGQNLTAVGELLGEYADQNEDAARAQKAFALSGILLNQAQSISEGALAIAKGVESASAVPFPANIPAILSVVAEITGLLVGVGTSIAQAKQIFSQANAGNFEHGGTIDGTSYTGDKLIAYVNSGEGIYTGKQANNLLQEVANNPARGGIDYERMGAAFASAISQMPAPVMTYQEFQNFEQEVTTYNELAAI